MSIWIKCFAAFEEGRTRVGVNSSEHVLLVSINQQKLWHVVNGQLLHAYSVSTGKKPPSCIENSLGTPRGLHIIEEKIGQDAALGMIFKGRVPTGTCYQDLDSKANERSLVTTRILRLRGLQDGINRGPGIDTWDRYIYIHGTNHEERIGSPDTHGCIALLNDDIRVLFSRVPEKTLVWIEWPEDCLA